MKGKITLVFLVALLTAISLASALEFNGTVKDEDGNLMNDALINVTVRDMNGWSVIGYNSTRTNASGWFNLTLSSGTSPPNFLYEPVVTANTTDTFINYRSKSLPSLPGEGITMLSGLTFYLAPAGTLYLTAINASNAAVNFNYQVKDVNLGYPVAEQMGNAVSSATLIVPRNKNYSIMIYPHESMPVSFDWNNFSSEYNYSFDGGSYNASRYTLWKQFNTSMTMTTVTGYFNYSDISGWDELKIIPYLLEPGNMMHLEYGDMPFNMSGGTGLGDDYNLSSGFYNLSLPATHESSTIMLFANARNGTEVYGGFKNISLSYGSASVNKFNFTKTAGLFGLIKNITLDDHFAGGKVNITTKMQTFSILNSSNSVMESTYAHVEALMDYSSLGAKEFTWMIDVSQSSAQATFTVPMLNSTGIKELNIFASGGEGEGQFAPKRKSYLASEIYPVMNVSLANFNPGAIGESLGASAISIELFYSNSTCDVPNPPSACSITGSSTMATFNPMKSIMGGGKFSFRMGTGGIFVHYVNVDLLASGPPDALFDSNSTETTSSDAFSAAVKFGSNGPRIYDYVLVSLPYTESTTTQSGLNESQDINMSLPYFYKEDDWDTPLWNTSLNGTSAASLAANVTHYAARQSEWSTLMTTFNCTRTVSEFNAARPCYIDTTNNKVWIRLPHFSGTAPSVTGTFSVYTAAGTPAGDTPSSSSSPGGATTPLNVYRVAKIEAGEEIEIEINDEATGLVDITIEVKEVAAAVKLELTKHDSLPDSVGEEPEESVYRFFEIEATNLPSDNLKVAKIKFEVENDWLEDNDLEAEDIVLMRYIGRWQVLSTGVVSESTSKVVFEAKTPGFSIFAITALISEEIEEVEEQEALPAIEPEVAEPVVEGEDSETGKWLVAIIVILAILLVGALLFKKRGSLRVWRMPTEKEKSDRLKKRVMGRMKRQSRGE